ncbi:hypothetical protein [Macrococcus carouselicus]|uniref:Asparagine synthetase domain-containing protein n=1 Tax=Macrococcus carouselicus TaxID=69969 RepID=A0A9Q8FQX3_9STAP|nr:hypothetical protein [Macrococcus carouselicus]TDM03831.1 hypothetical protein ERX40_01315 [Macrococcus carouselicus]
MLADQHYFKGFTLSEQPLKADHIRTIQLGKSILSFDRELQTAEYKGESHLVLIGYAVLAEDISLTAEQILERLDGLSVSDRHHLLNRLNGRYILLIAEDEIKIYPDATTMRPLFYCADYPVVASHSALAAESCRQLYGTELKCYSGEINGYLDYSRYEGVYKLNPNTYLSFGSQKTTRFFPDQPFETMALSEVLNQSIEYFSRIKEWLKMQDTYMTITAGIDSRLSLAVMHDPAIPLLTYNSLGKLSSLAKLTYENDVRTVQSIVDDLGLNHRLIHIENNDNVSDATKTYSSQFESTHSFSLSEKMAESNLKGKLHIKSNIFELAKLPVVTKYYETKDFRFMATIVKKKPKALHALSDDQMVEDYLKRADLSQEKAKGHYLADLYYQEQRMGNWHSNVTQETDNSVDIFILLNTREMLRLVTSAPVNVRKNRVLHREWINHFWPVLNFYPINDEGNLYELYREHNEQLVITGEGITFEDGEVLPKWPMTQTDIPFSVTNKSADRRMLDFRSYYSNPNALGTIKIKIGSETYNYQDIVAGHTIKLDAGDTVQCAIIFNKCYDRESWQKAARLTIK